MLLIIILCPLLGFFSGSIFGHFLGRGATLTTLLSIFLPLLCSLSLLYKIILNGTVYTIKIGSWFFIDNLTINWSFCFDSLTSIMLVIVTFISTLVHLYSIEYMSHDPHLPRFMSYLSLFTFFMLILITANNFLQMFIGWEGVGVSSYILINFWFSRIQANKAAIKAMLFNRIGDFCLLLAIISIFMIFSSLDYDIVFNLIFFFKKFTFIIGSVELVILDFIALLLFCGAIGKSAQLGLHSWLPDAMEGPTPVSALIHAATMVTAGIFLIVRCSFLFEFTPTILNFIIVLGSITALFASTTGLFQNDIKKVIAYSTCSQLGYMLFACGLSGYEVGIFHLSNHAIFKALLFLGAGSIIHAVSDEQDMRKLGGLQRLLPFSYSVILIGSLALMGIPFLTGFYSKDTILELAYAKYTQFSQFSYYLGSIAAFFTAFYSVRLLFLVFLAEPNGQKNILLDAHESSWKMGFPLFILAIFSICIGYLTQDLFIGFGTHFWGNSLFIFPSNYILMDIEFIPVLFKLFPLIFSIIGAIFAYFLYTFNLSEFYMFKQTLIFKYIYNFLNKKWYFDRIYNEKVSQYILYLSYTYMYKDIDRGIIEKLGPFGLIFIIKNAIIILKNLQSGFISHYLFLFVICIIFILFIILINIILAIPIILFILFYIITFFFTIE